MKPKNAKLISKYIQRQQQFGKWIRKQRKAKGISADELGERLGISRGHLYQVEAGIPTLTPLRVIELADALDLPTDEVLYQAGYALGDSEFPSELLRFNDLSERNKGMVIQQIAMLHRAQQVEG